VTAPRWLLEEQAYIPRPDRDAFIDKSIRALLRLLSRIHSRDAREAKRAAVDARMKLLSLLVLIVLVSLSRATLFVPLVASLLLALLASRHAEVIRDVLKVSLAATGFTVLILLPSAFWGNAEGAVRIVLKVFVCTTATRLLSATMEWSAMTRAMAGVRVPDLLVLVLDVTVLYLWLLGRVSLALLHALRLRSVGRNRRKTAALSGVAGILFLKSRGMAEDLYAAMECRGFAGTYRTGRAAGIRLADAAVLAADALLVASFVALGA
jgi:cobalt/nickel transport system permease protein